MTFRCPVCRDERLIRLMDAVQALRDADAGKVAKALHDLYAELEECQR